MNFDINQIQTLADLAIEKNLAEITVADGDKSVTVKLPVSSSVSVAPQVIAASAHSVPTQASTAVSKSADSADADKAYYKVTAPMVGTYYSASAPDAPPYVSVGATIAKGQTLCILEAMKMMNELESEISGKVVKVLVENGQPVEYGQTLMLVDTK